MQNSFGTLINLKSEKDFARYFFWSVIEKEAKCVIEDLSIDPFQAYLKALKLNGDIFQYQAFGYPASRKFFEDTDSVRQFHNALDIWQKKYNLIHISYNQKAISFNAYFIKNHIDFFPNIAANIFNLPERKTVEEFSELSESEKDKVRVKYIQKKEYIYKFKNTADERIAESYLSSFKKNFNLKSKEDYPQKLKNDWITKQACDFMKHWSLNPIDFDNLFLSKSFSILSQEISAQYGFISFTLEESLNDYAKRMAEFKVKSDEIFSTAKDEYKEKALKIIKKIAVDYLIDARKKFLVENPYLALTQDLPNYEIYFIWLVKAYVLSKQYKDIVEETKIKIEVSRISKEVKKIAKILELVKPNHLKQGRIKGSKNNITSKLGKN